MYQNTHRHQQNLDVAPDGPALQVFEIRLQAEDEIVFMVSRPAKPSQLREAAQAGLQTMALPISVIDFSKQLRAHLGADRVRARSDKTHLANVHVEQLRLVERIKRPTRLTRRS